MWRSTYCSMPAPIAPLKRNVMGEPSATLAAPAAGDTDMNAASPGGMSGPIISRPPPQPPPRAAVRGAANAPILLVI